MATKQLCGESEIKKEMFSGTELLVQLTYFYSISIL